MSTLSVPDPDLRSAAAPVLSPLRETVRVLVVEDDEDLRLGVRMLLESAGYEVREAGGGREALAAHERWRPHVVVADWNLPELDGLSLVAELRRRGDSLPYVLLLTGRTGVDDRVAGLAGGANDYLTKPFDDRELLARIETGVRQLAVQARMRDYILHLEENQDQARRAQRRLLPDRGMVLPGWRWDYLFRPSDFVGGDGLDLVPEGPQRVVVAHFDVSGHGLPAVMLAVTIQRLLRTRMAEAADVDPARIVASLNQDLQYDDTGHTFSMFLGLLDLRSGRLSYTRAGHPVPLVLRADGRIEGLRVGALLVGIIPGATWDVGVAEIRTGDRVLVYSDGVPEARDPHGHTFDLLRLARAFKATQGEPPGAVLQAVENVVKRFAARLPFEDDFSMLCLERLA